VSAMADMSAAIREVIESHSVDMTVRGLSDQEVEELASILHAFYADLREEIERRGFLS
jgi:hypothetical protein